MFYWVKLVEFVHKLHRPSISGKLILPMEWQHTVLSGKTFRWSTNATGFPHGSILGSLFFLIYVHDLTDDWNSDVKLSADHTSNVIVVQMSLG